MNSDNYKPVDTIKQALDSITRLDKSAGIHIIISCIEPCVSIISTNTKRNFLHFIHTGPIYNNPIYDIYMKDESKTVIVPKGYAYYKIGCLDGFVNVTKFKIDDIK